MYFLDQRFLAFVPLLVFVYWVSGTKLRDWVLLAGNVAWLCMFSPATVIALSMLTLGVVYPATQLAATSREGKQLSKARLIGGAGIAALVLAISWVRLDPYLGSGLDPSSSFVGDQLVHCIGLSYFILKGVHAIVAAASGLIPAPSVLDLLHYTLFFPTLTSGPIYRLDTFETQRRAPKQLSWDHVHDGLTRILLGVGKKVVAVPYLRAAVEACHGRGLIGQPLTFVALYVMLFIDFSGYSDIAIGLGRLLGFDVPENFKKPFTSTTLTQFWRNWHATLGDWVRETLFIPLGGIRAKGVRLAAIVVASMLLVGIWHSYSAIFVAWGAYHGTLLLLEHQIGVKPLRRHQTPWWRMMIRYAWIQAAVIGGMFAFLQFA